LLQRRYKQNQSIIQKIDYLSNVEIHKDTVKEIYHKDGRLEKKNGVWQYEYWLKDHLGNLRSAFRDINNDSYISQNEIITRNDYYAFGLEMAGSHLLNGNRFAYGGKERLEQMNLGLLDFGARNLDKALGRWLGVDPMASKMPEWSPYSYGFNNPLRFIDPDGQAPDDIILRGANNSSVTLKTDLIDINVNVSSLGVDFGGNYSLEGEAVISAGLDLVGIVDPTGMADGLNAGLQVKNGDYGGALISSLGLVPYVGDIAKVGKIAKDVKIIENAIDAVKAGDNAKGAAKGTDYVVTPKGEAIKIPDGGTGPTNPNKGSGMVYQGGSGGKGIDSRTTGVRIMDANSNQGKRVNYTNNSGQTVDPSTGRTISNKDPRGHLPLKDY
jgi:RHS repeat-associated protein